MQHRIIHAVRKFVGSNVILPGNSKSVAEAYSKDAISQLYTGNCFTVMFRFGFAFALGLLLILHSYRKGTNRIINVMEYMSVHFGFQRMED